MSTKNQLMLIEDWREHYTKKNLGLNIYLNSNNHVIVYVNKAFKNGSDFNILQSRISKKNNNLSHRIIRQFKIFNILFSHKIDIVNWAYITDEELIGICIYKRIFNKNLIVLVKCDSEDITRNRSFFIKKKLYNNIDRLFVENEDLREIYSRYFDDQKISTLYNPSMLESYDLPSPTKKKNKKNLLFAGRISREKGIIRLLEIFKKYSLKNKEATLRLILLHDDYNYWIEVKKLIKELVFAGFRVHYQINPSIVDIHKYYSLSDILCITSLSEGTPNVISDAFYMNLVVVSFNVGKISSLITDKQLLCDSEYEFNLALKYLHNDDNYSYFQRKYSALYAEKMSFNQFKRKIKV